MVRFVAIFQRTGDQAVGYSARGAEDLQSGAVDQDLAVTIMERDRPGEVTGIGDAIQVDSATDYSLAVQEDGTVMAWGSDFFGRLGDGEGGLLEDYSAEPVQVKGLTDVIQVGADYSHALALKGDGTVWAWGDNAFGQIGDGSSGWGEERLEPVQVQGLSDVVAVSAGRDYSLALKEDGTVWTWGRMAWKEEEPGGTGAAPASGLQRASSAAAGASHSSVIKEDGSIWSWGEKRTPDLEPQRHVPDPYLEETPVQVPELSGVEQISAGGDQSLAVQEDGTLWAWGNSPLGDGSDGSSERPVQVPGMTDVEDVSASNSHILVAQGNGEVWSWGSNLYGQLGDGSTDSSEEPVEVQGLNDAVAVSAGSNHSLAVDDAGSIWTWGANLSGQLGDGNRGGDPGSFDPGIDQNTPVEVDLEAAPAEAPDAIEVYLDGEVLELDDRPYIEDGRTLAPMRSFFQALGAEVDWDDETRTAIGTRNGTVVEIPIGSTEPEVDGEPVELEVAAQIRDGRTYIPLRFVGEALGDEVSWDDEERRIDIITGS